MRVSSEVDEMILGLISLILMDYMNVLCSAEGNVIFFQYACMHQRFFFHFSVYLFWIIEFEFDNDFVYIGLYTESFQ